MPVIHRLAPAVLALGRLAHYHSGLLPDMTATLRSEVEVPLRVPKQ